MLLHRPSTARTPTVRRALVLLLSLTTATTLLVACGDDQPTSSDETTTTAEGDGGGAVTDSSLDDVEVNEEDSGPVLEFDKPFGVSETTSRVITEGDGDGPVQAYIAGVDGQQARRLPGGTS